MDGGTVLFDEIGELPPLAQSMLLRFLQSGEGRAGGATGSTRVDVRVIAATHRDLEAAVEEGAFPEDFYYRLRGAVLEVPALRARREDIPLLVEHFRREWNREDQLAVEGFTERHWRSSRPTPGRGTCASWSGSCTGPWPSGVEGRCSRRM